MKEDLRIALELMARGAGDVPTESSLRSLRLIDAVILENNLHALHDPRQLALFILLERTIYRELTFHRELVLSPAYTDKEKKHAPEIGRYTQEIARDFSYANEDVRCWSLLYYGFVAAHPLTIAQLSKITNLTERQVRRYRELAISKLTRILARDESQMVKKALKRQLYKQLPKIAPKTLYGREKALHHLSQLSASSTACVVVSGPAGVGKTALVEAFLRDTIEDDRYPSYDQIIWIQSPGSVADILVQIYANLSHEHAKIEISDYFAYLNVVVVIDNLDHIISTQDDFKVLLQDLSEATVFLIHRDPLLWISSQKTLRLTNLEREAAFGMISHLLAKEQTLRPDEYSQLMEHIYQRTDGNPYAIEVAIQHALLGNPEGTLEETPQQGFTTVFHQLDESGRKALLTLAVSPIGKISFYQIRDLLPDIITLDACRPLLKNGVPVVVSQQPLVWRIDDGLKQAVRRLMMQDTGVGDAIVEISYQVRLDAAQPRDDPEQVTFRLRFILSLIDHLPLPVPFHLIESWLFTFLSFTDIKYFAEWHLLMNRYFSFVSRPTVVHPRLLIAKATNHYMHGEYESAAEFAESAARTAGLKGFFTEQIIALLTLGRIHQAQGLYLAAEHALKKAMKTAQRLKMQHYENQIIIELAQLALDVRDMALAEHYIQMAGDNADSGLLRAEITFLKGDFDRARDTAFNVLPLYGASRHRLGRIHNLIARSSDQLGDYAVSRYHYRIADEYFTETGDTLAIGRVKANLGASYLRQKDLQSASVMLQQARHYLEMIKDRLGLAVVQHNIGLLKSESHEQIMTI